MCAGLHDDYLSCLLTDQQGDCAFRGDCIGEATDYLGCAAGVITTQSCAGPECACSTETAFGAQLLFDCFGPECGCFTDGEPVAKCTNAFAAPCDAGFNCCWALFMLYAVPG